MKLNMKLFLLLVFVIFISLFLINQKEWVSYFKAGEWDTLREMMGNEWKSILMITMGFMLMQNVISLIPFLLGTFIGNTIFVFILSLFSVGVISLEHQFAIYLVLSVLILGFVVLNLKKRSVVRSH
ncbi:hypothetical protein [Alkalihalobacterium chitinilyticum]|uniref:Uncharacterized protein n=1 Tax=Alkalihalobacterium chitinilyticum TaxID=2980103 RepID=A0ABT5VQ11_9BACI|nr:hypothetical protein [Alkalihalobacterium chitinilyticum]MDE5416339.1 hypothetical protein [Alkalihalobacterium chitinilyticum]